MRGPIIDHDDFDDGGTPAWRARLARQPQERKPPFAQEVILSLFMGLILPFIVIIGGLLILDLATHLGF